MEFWKKEKLWLSVCAALGVVVILAACLVYSFTSYREQIIAEQKEQLLTIAKAVSNSISVYTEFYFGDLEDLESYEEYQRAGAAYLRMGSPFSTLKKQKKPMIHVFKRMIGFSVD